MQKEGSRRKNDSQPKQRQLTEKKKNPMPHLVVRKGFATDADVETFPVLRSNNNVIKVDLYKSLSEIIRNCCLQKRSPIDRG